MFTSGLPSVNTSSTDDLLSILTDNKKAIDTIKSLKEQNLKLAKAKKELLKAKSLKAFCAEQEKLAAKYKLIAEDAIADIAMEREAAAKAAMLETKELNKLKQAVNAKATAVKNKEQELQAVEASLEEEWTLVDKAAASAKAQAIEGVALQKEYTDKLADLKERMKGL